MKYLKKYSVYKESKQSSHRINLLDLKNNEDKSLISEIQNLIKIGDSILEISCGNAADAIYLKSLGYDVTCTDNNNDFVNNCIDKGIECVQHDTSNNFPFERNSFDLIYCRLGLHYFDLDKLDNIFRDLSRITKKYLVFSVKTENNEETGKIIFNKDTWINTTSTYFNIIDIKEKSGSLYGIEANWIEIVASKK